METSKGTSVQNHFVWCAVRMGSGFWKAVLVASKQKSVQLTLTHSKGVAGILHTRETKRNHL